MFQLTKTSAALGLLMTSGLLWPTAHAAAAEAAVNQVTVTATRNERISFDVPQSVDVVSARAIADKAVANLPDALAGEAGLLIQKSNTGGGAPFIRGLTGKQVLILVDGVRVNNSYFRFGPHQYLNTIELADISQVEVVHGPASVLYGSDAMGGVINVITRRPQPAGSATSTTGRIDLSAATADRSAGARVQVEHNQGDIWLLAGVGGKHFGDLEGGRGVGRQVPTGYDERSAHLKLAWRLAEGRLLELVQQYLQQNDVPKTNEVVLGSKAKFDYEPQLRWLNALSYRDDRLGSVLADSLKLTVSYNLQKEGEHIIERATPTLETRERTDVATLGLGLQLHKQLGEMHQLTYGIERYADRYDTRKQRLDLAAGSSTAVSPGTPDGARYTTLGVYLQDEIRLGSGAQLVAGLRHSRFEAEGQVAGRDLQLSAGKTTASLSGLVTLMPGLNLVGALAQGYRAPNMEDFFGRVDFVSEIPNTDLKPESALSREIGLKFQRGGTAARLHYFVSSYADLISRVTVAPGVRQRQNLRRARISGIEASLQQRLAAGLDLRASVVQTRGEDSDTGNPLQRIPPLNGSVHLRHAASASLWADLGLVFASRQDRLSPEDLTDPRIPAGGTPGYGVLDLRVGWQPLRGHDLVLKLENLGNVRYKTHGSGVYGAGRGLALHYTVRL